METREVLLVDAFAAEALSGVSVPVVLEGSSLTDAQLRNIGEEFGSSAVVTDDDEGLRLVDDENGAAFVDGAIAGAVGLLDREALEPGSLTITARTDGDAQSYPVTVTADREVTVDLPEQPIRESEASFEDVAACLGLPASALEGVGEDLPPGVVTNFGGTLIVGVDYLENLSKIEPNGNLFEFVRAETNSRRLVALTFDTLEAANDVHVRTFEAGGPVERASSGAVVGGVGAFLSHRGAFDGQRNRLRVESGYFVDRPGTVTTELSAEPSVSGHALIAMEGTVAIPEDDGDDIIEA